MDKNGTKADADRKPAQAKKKASRIERLLKSPSTWNLVLLTAIFSLMALANIYIIFLLMYVFTVATIPWRIVTVVALIMLIYQIIDVDKDTAKGIKKEIQKVKKIFQKK